MITYLIIFGSKMLENALGTLRMIVVSNNKKLLGSILQFVIAIVWVLAASLAITDIYKDPLKILVFALASAIGSYLGCKMEQVLAIGNNVLFCITSNSELSNILRKEGYELTLIDGHGINDNKYVLMIMIPRKIKKGLMSLINKIDSEAVSFSGSFDWV